METPHAPALDVEAPADDVAPVLIPFLIAAAAALLLLYLARRYALGLAAACACGGPLDVDGYCAACGALDGRGPAAPPPGVEAPAAVDVPPPGTGSHLAGHDGLAGRVVALDDDAQGRAAA